MRLSWRVATYEDLTPSAASSGFLGPTRCLGVLDASVDCDSNLFLHGNSVPKTL